MKEIQTVPRAQYNDHPLLKRLLELHDVPNQLYIQGQLPEVTIDEYGRSTPRILTIVGARKHTSYGKLALEKLLRGLSNQNIIILSGLALGIDGIAHREALNNSLKTIAIPGSGLNPHVLYPSSHKNLAGEILDSGGTLISELSPDTQAAPWTFPARNRIMAALSDAVLIIEAEEESGTLITGRQALELGRDIGAIPGEIFSPTSVGTNTLLRDGAYVITGSDDILSLLHLSKKENKIEDTNSKATYTEDEQVILDLLHESQEKDTLLLKSNLPIETFLITFSSLEMKGVIVETFGEVRRLV